MGADTAVKLTFCSVEDLESNLDLEPCTEEHENGALVTSKNNSLNDGHAVLGYALTQVKAENGLEVDCSDKSFSDILSCIRDSDGPLHLVCRKVDQNGEPLVCNSESISPTEKPLVQALHDIACDPKTVSGADIIVEEEGSSSSLKENEVATSSSGSSDVNAMHNSILSWTSRVRKSSAQFAAEAAQQAAVAIATATTRQTHENDTPPESDLVRLYIQSSSGAHIPLNAPGKSSEKLLSNNSLISVRASAANPCPADYKFQWYRSNDDRTWMPLLDATRSSLQPSAVDVGCRLRCIVAIFEGGDDTDHSDDGSKTSLKETRVVCQTPEAVCSAAPMFSGARTALNRGAQFGGVTGRGNANGRYFRLKVGSGQGSSSGAELCIYQVVGDTAEPMHDEASPILHVSAATSYDNGKNLDLIFTQGIPECASMVEALTTEGKFQISFPNRLGRESFLLAIGIANFKGKPADLTVRTRLFQSDLSTRIESESESESGTKDSSAKSAEEAPITEAEDVAVDGINVFPECISLKRQLSVGSRTTDSSRSRCLSSESDAEQQVQSMRSRLMKREETISDLQRQISRFESKLEQYSSSKDALEKDVISLRDSKRALQKSLCESEKSLETKDAVLKRTQAEHGSQLESLKEKITHESGRASALEKNVRNLENERAVLAAAVEARDAKLGKMSDLQSQIIELTSKLAEKDNLDVQLGEAQAKVASLTEEVSVKERFVAETLNRVEVADTRAATLQTQLDRAEKSTDSLQAELSAQQLLIQRLKAERNNFKQKSDSLAKEMAKICRNGRSVSEVEKIIADDSARRQEVALLRSQKQTALEELDQYRAAQEHSRDIQVMSGINQDQARLMERNAELERLLSELTEYVSAKEMQLNTLKEVNEAFQVEITTLSRAARSRNLGKNEV